MHWLKREIWKASIALAGLLLLLILMVWVPVSAAGASERALGLATPGTGTVQATPTVDPTMAALQKEQLAQQVNKLKNDNAWAWLSPVSIILGPLATIGTILVGIFVARNNLLQWSKNREDEQKKREVDQRIEREKRDEERFQKVVEGLGSERTEAKVGAAITLRTYLEPGYERFYRQAFDLAVAHLRLRKVEASASEPPSSPAQVPIIPKGTLRQEQQLPPSIFIPLDSLSQALITVFKESFWRAREELKKTNAQFNPQLLDATDVRLDHAYLANADLAEAWLVRASLREADLSKAQIQGAVLELAQLQGAYLGAAWLQGTYLSASQLQGAYLRQAHLEGANLGMAHLEGADLFDAHLNGADLSFAQLEGADLSFAQFKGSHFSSAHLEGADLSATQLQGAFLWQAQLQGANLERAELQGALLWQAQLQGANLEKAQLQGADLKETNPETADSLKGTRMHGVTGLTPEQREKCIQKGSIFDDVQQAPASTTSSPALPPSEPSNETQAPAAPSAQVNTPPPETGGNGAASSQQCPES